MRHRRVWREIAGAGDADCTQEKRKGRKPGRGVSRRRVRGEDRPISCLMAEVMLTLEDREINMSRASHSKRSQKSKRPIQYEENT